IPDGRNKCNFDVEIAVDIMDIIAERNLPDVVVLVSGDSDFCYLIERIKKEGSRVIVVGSYLSVSVESKAAADSYIFTENISDEISL
ncbi:MAG: NYN domain-containing protein, partial [Parcubacteria group bacterium]